MGFGDYNKTNLNLIQDPKETPKVTKVEKDNAVSNNPPIVSNDSDKSEASNPVEEYKVVSYQGGGNPRLLDFGLFDYRNNQKSFPDTKADVSEKPNYNDFLAEFSKGLDEAFKYLAYHGIDLTPTPDYGHVSRILDFGGEADAKTCQELRRALQEMKNALG